MEEPLRRAFGLLINRGYAGEWMTMDGCVAIRPMTGSKKPSTHGLGLALDLNQRTNGYGAEPTLSEGFVACFKECGFEWGGDWNTPDGMHFQLPRTA